MRRGEIAIDRQDVGLLKAGRNALHWSQKDLAKASGVSLATIKRIEMEESVSRIERIREDSLKIIKKRLGSKLSNNHCPKKTFVRRENIEAILLALEHNGLSLWQTEGAVGISLDSIFVDRDLFAVAKDLKNKKSSSKNMK